MVLPVMRCAIRANSGSGIRCPSCTLIETASESTCNSYGWSPASARGRAGGVVVQPALGRAADVWGYATSYVIGAGISAFSLPFIALSRSRKEPADTVESITEPATAEAPA